MQSCPHHTRTLNAGHNTHRGSRAISSNIKGSAAKLVLAKCAGILLVAPAQKVRPRVLVHPTKYLCSTKCMPVTIFFGVLVIPGKAYGLPAPPGVLSLINLLVSKTSLLGTPREHTRARVACTAVSTCKQTSPSFSPCCARRLCLPVCLSVCLSVCMSLLSACLPVCLFHSGTFDMTLLLVTIAWLGVNVGLTIWLKPSLFDHAEFWLLQVGVFPCVLCDSPARLCVCV